MTREQFYIVEPSIRDAAYPGIYVTNWENLIADNPYRTGRHHLPGGRRAGLPEFPCAPKLALASERRKTPPKDVELIGFQLWFVSDRFKRFAEALDKDAFEFVACDNSELLFNGEPLTFWACGVRRFGSYLDEANSQALNIREESPGWRTISPQSNTQIAVDRKLLGDARVFSLVECWNKVFCDDQFKRAYNDAKLTTLSFTHV